ncbi:DUF2516 family protein [Streptomyces huiliensis]|uniref:DUF2516 family protein n=1 Tax=Streptomyces huiliensis TaxID=2876027 RepID=UPI001CBF11E5|nr:DUF2516 family protein [Streptomyces huiliensis]MBZ4319121.1 DUF2516 family protein [Streptomyces huiliensis]
MLVQGFNTIWAFVSLGLLVFAVAAFLNAAIHRDDAYRAAAKQNKGFWLIILGLTVAVDLFLGVWGFLPILGLVATIVYFVDVRPALKQVSGRGPRRRGSSSDGPYGPYNGGR